MTERECPHPEKHRYRSLKTAAAGAIRASRDLGPMRPYRCRCQRWHLTTKEKRDPMTTPQKMCWVDIETTGLGKGAQVLEVGMLVTDADLNELDSIAIIPKRHGVGSQIQGLEPAVIAMHIESGLLRAWADAPYVTDAEKQLIEFYRQHFGASKVPMCGSSVHFDRDMLRCGGFTNLVECFSHRNVDVSTLKEVARLRELTPWEPPGVKSHRVLDDLRDSIHELGHYLNAWGLLREAAA